MEDEVACVVALDKNTGFIGTTTSCLRSDSQKYAKYYRSIGYNARVVNYDELEQMLEEEKQYRRQYC